QRTEHVNAGAHGAHQVIGGLDLVHVGGVDLTSVVLEINARPELLQYLGHGSGVRELRYIAQSMDTGCQQRRRHDGESRILGAADLDPAAELPATSDYERIHRAFSRK